MQYLRIPLKRVAVLIGEHGAVLDGIQKRTKTKINVNETSVEIDGEALDEWVAADVVKAVGRGFSPEIAMKLLRKDMILLVLPLKDMVHTKKELERKKGRVIGEKGRSRRHLEHMTNTDICVYGTTIGIIGQFDDVDLARDAVVKLIQGSRHNTVYKYLEKQRRYAAGVYI